MERSDFVLRSQAHLPNIARVLIDDAPTLDLNGELLDGRYRLRERLGYGGAGVVHLADDLLFPRRPVAVKVSRATGAHEEQRFQDEIEVLGALHHPNIVAPLAWGRTPCGRLYLVMELLRGQNLLARLRLGPLAARDVLLLGVQVGEALLAAHAAGVLHRDVKPSNILVLESNDLRVKLIDFGVAKKAPERWPGDGERCETATNAAPGTPPYLPPEAGRVPPDAKFDVFGFAATLFEAATGRKYDLSGGLGDLPAGLGEVLGLALALDADARPTLAAMVADLVRLRDARSLPGYELLRQVGRGGKAEVWLAAQRLAGRDVVVKRLQERATEDDAIRLRVEGRVLAALEHPAFPTLLDAVEIEGRLHLVMTRARGEQALAFIEARLQPAQVIAVGIALMQALLALHGLGVLHRDLHAGNVMLDFEGPHGRPVVTILDLGMCELRPAWWARLVRYATPPERRARLGSARQETLQWSAPETASTGWTEKSDVWSAGALLYRLLTGRWPFAPKAKAILTCPRQHRADCPDDLAQALLAALHPDPTQRLSAAGFLERLRDAQEGDDDDLAAVAPAAATVLRDATKAAVEAPTVATDPCDAPAPSVAAAPADAPAPSATDAPASDLVTTDAPAPNAVTAPIGTTVPQDPPEPIGSASQAGRKDTRRSGSSARRLTLAAAAVLLGGLLVRNAPEPASSLAPERATVEAPPKAPAQEPEAPARTHAEPVPPPSALAAIEASRERLRRCSPATFTVELTARAGDDHVDSIDVLGAGTTSACAREILTALRFAPGPAEHVVLEVVP